MNRLLFEKTGDAVFLSHLDLMRIFQRAFKRADIMIWHSQGYSPRAYVSIALPLSVGTESVCEILDFEIEDGSVELTKLPTLLNRTLPAGVRVLSAYESANKIKNLFWLEAEVTLEYDAGMPAGTQKTIADLFSQPELVIVKHGKKGDSEVNLKERIRSLELRSDSQQELTIHAVVQAQNPGLNPQLLVQAIDEKCPGCRPDFARIRRMEVYDCEMRPFR